MSTRMLKRGVYWLIAAHIVASVVMWPLLPDQMPLHFGFDGQLTSSAPRSPVLWFLVPALTWGLAALVIAASGPPESWQLSKDGLAGYRELSENDQTRVRDAKDRTLYITLMLFVVIMASVQAATFIVAEQGLDRLPLLSSMVMFAALIAVVIVNVRGGRSLESLIRSADDRKSESSPRGA